MNFIKVSLIFILTVIIIIQITHLSGELKNFLHLIAKPFFYVLIAVVSTFIALSFCLLHHSNSKQNYEEKSYINSIRGLKLFQSRGIPSRNNSRRPIKKMQNGHQLISKQEYQRMTQEKTKSQIQKLMMSREYSDYLQKRYSGLSFRRSQLSSKLSEDRVKESQQTYFQLKNLQDQIFADGSFISDIEDVSQKEASRSFSAPEHINSF